MVSAGLAVTSLLGDSLTFDEINHLTAGVSYLETGDFRLGPGTPPLARMWPALPLLFVDHVWPDEQTEGWNTSDIWKVGHVWFYQMNDGERLLSLARLTSVVLLLATCLCVYATARVLFGAAAGLLALLPAVLSPTMLAHGRLVTTDMAATLCFLLTLLAFGQLVQRVSLLRLLAALLSLAVLSVVKMTWVLVVPALLVMALLVIVRREPWPLAPAGGVRKSRSARAGEHKYRHQRLARVGLVALVALSAGLVVWGAVWSVHGWRYSPFRGPEREQALLMTPQVAHLPPAENMPDAWKYIRLQPDGQPVGGLVGGFVDWARAHRVLPEVYLYGLAKIVRQPDLRAQYLNGRISETGWKAYFPTAFTIKTPISMMLLLLLGVAALVTGRVPRDRNVLLLVGLAFFVVFYFGYAIFSPINIGHRHILPIYPALFIFAGASASWLRRRAGQVLIGGSVAWLLIANIYIYPHYLCYFNEFISGPQNGHYYLADSNIDWGQDMKRLAKYAQEHPNEVIKLSYFGNAKPPRYGFQCESLPGSIRVGPPAELTAGTYVISVTNLLGVYLEPARDTFWSAGRQAQYREFWEILTSTLPEEPDPRRLERRQRAATAMRTLTRHRLINRLRYRRPDTRIGYSLFVYRLTQQDVDALIQP